jgi:hypothetical protein
MAECRQMTRAEFRCKVNHHANTLLFRSPTILAATQQLGPKAKMVTCTGAFSRSIVVGFGRDFRQNLNRCEQGHPQSSGGAQ